MQCHCPTLRAAGQSSATLWDAPRGRSDAHEVPSAPGSSVLPRPSAQHGVRGMRPPDPLPRAQCWLCLQRPTALGRRLQGTLGACGLGVPPCASSTEQQCSTAELCSHTVHTWVQQRATPRRADVHSCRPSLPAPSAAHHRPGAAHRRHSAPHCAPRRHPEPRAAPPQPPGPPPRPKSHIPGLLGAGIQEGERGARGFAFLDSGSRFCSRLFPWKLASDLGK